MSPIRKLTSPDPAICKKPYQLDLRTPDGKRHRTRHATLREAKAAEAAAIAPAPPLTTDPAELNTPAPLDGPTWHELLDHYMAHAALKDKPSTLAGYRVIIRAHLSPPMTNNDTQFLPSPSTVSTQDLQEFVNDLTTRTHHGGRHTLSAARVVRIYALLRAAIKLAYKRGQIPFQPAQEITTPRITTPERTIIDLQQLNLLIAHPKLSAHPLHALFVKTAWYTGLRAGELAALTPADLTTEDPPVLIVSKSYDYTHGLGTTKNGRMRRVAIPQPLATELRAHSDPTDPTAPIFRSPTGDYHNHQTFMRRHFKPAVKAALPPELHGLNCHGMRHSHASDALSKGITIKQVQDRLGHSTAQLTLQTYAHRIPGDDAALVDKLGYPTA